MTRLRVEVTDIELECSLYDKREVRHEVLAIWQKANLDQHATAIKFTESGSSLRISVRAERITDIVE